MATPLKTEKSLKKLNKVITEAFDKRIAFAEDLNQELPILLERARGFAEGRKEPEYQLSKEQCKMIHDLVKMQDQLFKDREKYKELFEEMAVNSAYKDRFKNSKSAGGVTLNRDVQSLEDNSLAPVDFNKPVISFAGNTIDVKPH